MAARNTVPALKVFGVFIGEILHSKQLSISKTATLVNVTPSYVSQVIAGTTRCNEEFAERLDKALDAKGAVLKKWDELLRDAAYPRYFVDFAKAEAAATELRVWEADRIYGLFQTEAYARVLLGNDEDAVRARLARQKILDRKDAPLVCVILDEIVLYRQVGSREVMRAQIEHLIELSHRDRIHIQIAPVAHYPDVTSSFHIATQPNRKEVLYENKAIEGVTSTEAKALTRMNQAFLTLQARALNVEDSRAFLRKVLEEKWT